MTARAPQPRSTEPVTVAYVVTRLNVGGVARRLEVLATRTDLPSVVLCGATEEREGSLAEELERAGTRIVQVPGLRRRVSPLDDLRALWWLYRWFRRHRPLIVSTHTAKAGALGRTAALLAGVPVRLHTFHGHVLERYFGARVSAALRWTERRLAATCAAIVAVGPEVADDLERFRIGAGRVTIIRNGYDLDRLVGGAGCAVRAELGIPADAPVAGIVGRLAPVKNLHLFLDAAARVRRTLPRARFLIVGDGEQWDELHERARALGLEDAVTFCGWRSDLRDVYAAMDVAVCCSLNEGVPAALIEASGAERPLVGTDVGGVADVVEDGLNGHLTPSGDVDALSAAIERILADPEAARSMGRAGRLLVARKFGAGRLVSEVEALYGRLLSTRAAAPAR
jgi:glycosyltransferase involved in cell wall biosynthesis